MASRLPNLALDCRPEEQAFLQSVVAHPEDEALWLILADWLDEHDDPRRAELLRLHRRLIATCCEPDQHPQRAAWQTRLVELLSAGVCPSMPRQAVDLGPGVQMAFHFIPPGSFLMGSSESEKGRRDDEAQHRVTLKQGFWLAVTPVTQAQWQAVMGSNPSHFKGKMLPVEQVSWHSCQEFCRRLGSKGGEPLRAFRLPFEVEWEYACRAGTTTPYFFGETLGPELASCNADYPLQLPPKDLYRTETTPVGTFPCNAWGLFDMHGNVCEWCQDPYSKHPRKPTLDFQADRRGLDRVLRGGSWNNISRSCRAAFRPARHPSYRQRSIGFRAVCALAP